MTEASAGSPQTSPASTSSGQIALVAEEISRTADEGALRFLREMLSQLSRSYEVHAYHTRGDGHESVPCTRVHMSKLWVSGDLRRALRQHPPHAVLYVPSASATANALWRCRGLARCVPQAQVALVALQRREYGGFGPLVGRLLRPPRLITTSQGEASRYQAWGWDVRTVSLGVDLDRFRPVDAAQRSRLRQQFGWPHDRKVVLHVGHLRSGRGLDVLADVASDPRFNVVMVGSSSTAREPDLVDRLRAARVELHLAYQSRIEEFYQAADVYCFPVRERDAAIDFPLSVLEAMACNLPVLTTPHGSLPELFADVPGLMFFAPGAAPRDLLEALLGQTPHTREAVGDFGWRGVASAVMQHLGMD